MGAVAVPQSTVWSQPALQCVRMLIGDPPGFSAAMAAMGYMMQQFNAEKERAEAAAADADAIAPPSEDTVADMLRVDDVRLNLGAGLELPPPELYMEKPPEPERLIRAAEALLP